MCRVRCRTWQPRRVRYRKDSPRQCGSVACQCEMVGWGRATVRGAIRRNAVLQRVDVSGDQRRAKRALTPKGLICVDVGQFWRADHLAIFEATFDCARGRLHPRRRSSGWGFPCSPRLRHLATSMTPQAHAEQKSHCFRAKVK